MGKYRFYQDTEVTSWERDHFSIEVDSYEAAVAIVRSWNCENSPILQNSRQSTARARQPGHRPPRGSVV